MKPNVTLEELLQTRDRIAEVIADFLKTNNGNGNGYLTYAEGKLAAGENHITVMVPNADDLTHRQLRELGDKLSIRLKSYAPAYWKDGEGHARQPGYSFLIESEGLEWGIYKTLVSIILERKEVRL